MAHPGFHGDKQGIQIAQTEFDKQQPQVVVGSSRGGVVAMNINSGDARLVLLCPAWKKYGTVRTVKHGTTILHSRADDVIQERVRNSSLMASAMAGRIRCRKDASHAHFDDWHQPADKPASVRWSATFLVMDALALKGWSERFDAVTTSSATSGIGDGPGSKGVSEGDRGCLHRGLERAIRFIPPVGVWDATRLIHKCKPARVGMCRKSDTAGCRTGFCIGFWALR